MNSELKEQTNVGVYRLAFIEVKSLATLALKHLETCKDDDIPKDQEFREILWTLLNKMVKAGQEIDEWLSNMEIARKQG
jgi:hypothetical protein